MQEPQRIRIVIHCRSCSVESDINRDAAERVNYCPVCGKPVDPARDVKTISISTSDDPRRQRPL